MTNNQGPILRQVESPRSVLQSPHGSSLLKAARPWWTTGTLRVAKTFRPRWAHQPEKFQSSGKPHATTWKFADDSVYKTGPGGGVTC